MGGGQAGSGTAGPVQRIVNRAAEHGIPARPPPRHDQHDGGFWIRHGSVRIAATARLAVRGRVHPPGLGYRRAVKREAWSSYDGAPPPPEAPHRVRLAVKVHDWDHIAFLHWPFRRADIAHLVPDGTALLTFDEMAWVTITPFFIRVRPPGVPVVPPRRAFPETNLRTVRRGPRRKAGPLVPAHGGVRCVVRRDIAPIGPPLLSPAHVR